MNEIQRTKVLDYLGEGIAGIAGYFYERQYNQEIDIVPMVAAEAFFTCARIEFEAFGQDWIPSDKKEVHLAIRIAFPIILRLGVLFLASKIQGVSYKVWLSTIVWESVSYAVETTIECIQESPDIQNNEEDYNAENIEQRPNIESIGEGLRAENEGKNGWIPIVLQMAYPVVNLYFISPSLNKAAENRSPNFPSMLSFIPVVGKFFALLASKPKTTKNNRQFVDAFVLGLCGSWVTHKIVQRYIKAPELFSGDMNFAQLRAIWNIEPGPFSWKIEVAQLSAVTIASWALRSKDSSPPKPKVKEISFELPPNSEVHDTTE